MNPDLNEVAIGITLAVVRCRLDSSKGYNPVILSPHNPIPKTYGIGHGSRAPRRAQVEAPPHGDTAGRGGSRQHGESGKAARNFTTGHLPSDCRDGTHAWCPDL